MPFPSGVSHLYYVINFPNIATRLKSTSLSLEAAKRASTCDTQAFSLGQQFYSYQKYLH